MLLTHTPSPARPAHPPAPAEPESTLLEPVLLVHGSFANRSLPNGLHWWQPGSDYARELDRLLHEAGSKARCWAHLDQRAPFSWTGENSETARCAGGRALAVDIEALEADPRIGRYHLVAHSHGGNVIVNALSDLGGPPAKLGAVVYMGTPYLTFHHRTPIDTRWIAVPLYLAGIALCVRLFRMGKEYEAGSGIVLFALLLALLAEFLFADRRSSHAEARLYGSGVPRAFAFDGDEAISGLVSAQHVVDDPRAFIAQFVQVTPPPPPAVAPRVAPEASLSDDMKRSGVYVLLDLLKEAQPALPAGRFGVAIAPPRAAPAGRVARALASFLESSSADFPLKGVLVAILWVCLLLPRLLVALAVTVRAVAMRIVFAIVRWIVFGFAKLAVQIGMPILVRKAAFGADRGRFMRVAALPPGVWEAVPMSDALRASAADVSGRLGGRAGQSILAAIAGKDAFAIKTRVEHALSDASLLHSHYYQAPEVIAATAGFIADPGAGKSRAGEPAIAGVDRLAPGRAD